MTLMTSKPDFKVMVLLLVFMQLTRDLFAIAKFLLSFTYILRLRLGHDILMGAWQHRPRSRYVAALYCHLEVINVLREGGEMVVSDVEFVDGVSERTEVLRQFVEQVVRQIQPAYVLGQSQLLRDFHQMIIGKVQASHALEIVEVVGQLRQKVVRHVYFVDLRHLHLGRSELLQFVVRKIQSDWQLVHILRILPDRVV